MRRTQLAAACAFTLLIATAAPDRPALAARQAPQPPQTNQQTEQEAAKAASDPEVVTKLKKAIEAQAEISPYTLKALEHDPKALEAVGHPTAGASAQSAPAPAAKPGAGPKSGKAIYGDIIIHK